MYIYIYIYITSQKYWPLSKIIFLILKVLFLIKQVKYHNGFIHYSKYKSS